MTMELEVECVSSELSKTRALELVENAKINSMSFTKMPLGSRSPENFFRLSIVS